MGGVARMGWEDKVRTYNYSQNRVTDRWCGSEKSNLGGVLESRDTLEALMHDVKVRMQEGEAEKLVAEEARAREGRAKRRGSWCVEGWEGYRIEARRFK
jgi:peptide chain release factor 1